MRAFVCFVFLMCFATDAGAVTFNVNLSSFPSVPNTGGAFISGCSGGACGELYRGTQTPTYDLSALHVPGSTLMFLGTLDMDFPGYGNQYGTIGYFNPFFIVLTGATPADIPPPPEMAFMSFAFGCNIYDDPSCHLDLPTPLHINVYSSYAPFVSIMYSNGVFTPAQTTSAVPEPSTWILMIIGSIGIGAMTSRRKAAPRTARLATATSAPD